MAAQDRVSGRGQQLAILLVMLGAAVFLLSPIVLSYSRAAGAIECADKSHFECAVHWMQQLGAGGIVVSWFGMLVAALSMFPAEAVAMANGKVYGIVWGTLLSWSGAMIGANVAYLIARALGPLAAGRLVSVEQYERFRGWIQARGHLALLTLRLIPLFPYFAVNYGAGLLGMRWWTFNWVSAIGMLPAAFIFTCLGDMAGEIGWTTWLAILVGVIFAFWLTARLAARAS